MPLRYVKSWHMHDLRLEYPLVRRTFLEHAEVRREMMEKLPREMGLGIESVTGDDVLDPNYFPATMGIEKWRVIASYTMYRITKVKAAQSYRLELTFDDGVSGVVDLSDLAGKGVFSLWLDPSAFAQVRIGSSGELVWGDEIDLCPDAMYLRVTGKKPGDVFPGLRQETARA